jgi:hypothetical protein
MSDDYARVLNIAGLAFNLIGVLMLFRWGMPFHVPTHGEVGLTADGMIDQRALAVERIYTICGWAGLVFLLIGFALQLDAQLMPPAPLPPAKP